MYYGIDVRIWSLFVIFDILHDVQKAGFSIFHQFLKATSDLPNTYFNQVSHLCT